jgi:septal ring factor EnvC (AmiA/AmiB activator)
MSDTTDTPITDKHIGMIYRDGSPLIETCRDLERQLAEAKGQLASAERREADQIELRELNLKQLTDAREQRDRLAEALRECGKRGANPMTEYGYGNGKP